MADRELRINMSLSNTQTIQAMDEFGHAADKATTKAADGTKKVERGARDAAKGFDAMGSSAGNAGREMVNLIKAQVGLSALRSAAEGVSTEWRRIADDIGRASKEWQQFRASLQSVASLSSQQNTNAFAKAEVERAEKTNITPAAAKDFREAFMAQASLYIQGPEAKMSAIDADEFQNSMMEYAAAKGISQKDMAGFAGGLLSQEKGQTTAADMKAKAGKVFATLEASSATPQHLLPGVTRVMAQGLSAEEAAPKMAMLPQIAPEEESTHLLGVIAQLRKSRMEGKLEQFGVNDEMSPNQMVDTVVKGLDEQAGQGKGRGKKMDELLKSITEYHIAQDTLRGMANKGQAARDSWENLIKNTPSNVVDTTIAADRKSEAGIQRGADSRAGVADAMRGLRGDKVALARQEAETQLKNQGRLDHPLVQDFITHYIPFSDEMKDQQINRRALANARAQLGDNPADHPGDRIAGQSNYLTDALLKKLIERLDHQTKVIEKGQGSGSGRAPAALPSRPSPHPTRP